jgi:hypothetical protein
MLTTLRMNHPKDLAAIKEWVEVHAEVGQAQKMIDSLPSLPIGDAWFWDPAIDLFKCVTVRRRTTFDSGATPKAGQQAVTPKVLAPVDIKRLGATIAATIERAEADDPKILKAKFAKLAQDFNKLKAEKEAEFARQDAVVAEIVTKIVEKPVIEAGLLARLEKLLKNAAGLHDKQVVAAEEFNTAHGLLRQSLMTIKTLTTEQPTQTRVVRTALLTNVLPSHTPPKHGSGPLLLAHTSGNQDVSKAKLKILEACAWMEAIGQPEASLEAVAFLSDYTVSGHFNNMKGQLRSADLIEYPATGMIRLTDQGRSLAPAPRRPQTLDALHQAVLDRLDNARKKILLPLLAAYPRALSLEDLANQAEYTVSGHFNNMKGKLRTLGLVTYPKTGEVRAADLLFPSTLR